MDIRAALLTEHSLQRTASVVNYIGGDPGKFKELMRLFLGDNYRLTQRAAWALSYCAENTPELVSPYVGTLIKQLENRSAHNAVRRNVARLLQFVDIPERLRGRAFEACYRLVDDPAQPVAVRAFALTVAARVAEHSPELLDELRLIVEKHAPHTSIAFRKRASLVL
ncbi:MAG: hypothetical protein WKF34_11995 [Pyrinomonadaceae bacterium]